MRPHGASISRILIIGLAALSAATTARSDDPPTLQWIRQFSLSENGTGSRGVSADTQGNIFVAGDLSVATGAYLRKYDLGGNLQWSHIWEPVQPTEESVFAVDVWADRFGNAYWVGGHGPTIVTMDPFVYKFDSLGHVLWDYEVPNPEYNDGFKAVTGDNLGNLYMAGNEVGRDALLFKSNADGDIEWMRSFLIGYGGVTGVAADTLGSIFVAGSTNISVGGPNAGGYDAFLTKFNDEGDQLWTRQFGGATFDFANGVAADGMGNVFVAGWRELPTAVDAFVRKYDSEGKLLWNRQIGTVGANADVSNITSDEYGNIYVAGRTAGSLGGANAGGFDAFVRKYDSAGNILWTYQLGTSGYDGPDGGITLDGHGNVILSGGTTGNLGGPLVSTYGDAWIALLREYLPGDYNDDDVVDEADQLVWRAAFGSQTDLTADGNRNGIIDAADYVVWRDNLGGNFPSSSATNPTVPEPPTLALAAFALVATARFF